MPTQACSYGCWHMSSPTHASNRSPKIRTASAGVLRREAASAAVVRGRSSCRCRSEMKSMHRHEGGASRKSGVGKGGFPMESDFDSLGDHHVFERDVVMEALAAGFDLFDRINHFAASDHFAEHGIAPALRRLRLEVQEIVVRAVDEELCAGRVRGAGAGHGDGVLVVLQAVVGFVLDLAFGRLLLHAGLEPATLDHEALDDAVEDRAIVMTGLHVLKEVGHGDRGLGVVQFQADGASGGLQFNGLGHAYFSMETCLMMMGVAGTSP